MNVKEIIRAAARAKGAIDRYNDLDAAEYAEGLQALNSMLALWAAEGAIVHGQTYIETPLVDGQTSYTIGVSGADITTTMRPTDIVNVGIVNGDSDDVVAIPYSFRPTYPNPGITIDDFGLVGTLRIDYMQPLGLYTALEDELNVAPDTEEAIKYNLALRIVPEVPASNMIIKLAYDARRTMYHIEVEQARFDAAITGNNTFDITRG